MANDNNFKQMKTSTGGIIAPVITLALLFIFWRLGQKWIAMPALALLILFYLIMPKLIRARAARFHKRALTLLATGKAAEIPKLAKRQIILQLFGPSGPIDAKLGMAYTQMGDYASAAINLPNGILTAPDSEKPALQTALAKALMITGDLARAEVEGRSVLDKGIRIPELLATVARARVGLGKIDKTTIELMNEADNLSTNDDVKLMLALTRIEMALATGHKTDDIPESADSSQRFLRTWIHFVRGKLREHRRDLQAAEESYAKAVKTGKEEHCWFADLAHERLQFLTQGPSKQTDGNTEIDPAMRRKKKKRR